MTPAQVAHIMSLVENYADYCARARLEQIYGTSKSYTKGCLEDANEARAAVEAALRDAPQQAIPAGTRVVDRGFRFDGEKQEHIPQLVIEFEPAPVNSGHGAKGWKDRDYVAAMLTTCDCPAKDMPFGRCCKVTPSAPTAVEPDERDTERMNWLEKNLFHVEPDEWTAKHSPHLNTWRIFAPKGVQGSARNIIDAARASKGTPL